VLIWDLEVDGTPVDGQKLIGHSNSIKSVAFSSDGERIASIDRDGDVIVWLTVVSKKLVGEQIRRSYFVVSSPRKGRRFAMLK
jgi:WD40 repeat protein